MNSEHSPIDNNTTFEPKLKPASENVWYVMATLGGTPSSIYDFETIKKNADYWNALMPRLFESYYKKLNLGFGAKPQNCLKAIELLEARGFSLPIINSDFKSIDFSFTKFDTPVFFCGLNFPPLTLFQKSEFQQGSYFDNSRFMHGVNFELAAFFKNVSFDKTIFHSVAYFKNIKTMDHSLFTATDFYEQPQFVNAEFGNDASFNTARFQKGANFSDSKFLGNSQFRHARFMKETIFSGATFIGLSSFTKIDGVTLSCFKGANFPNHPPVFSDGEKLELMEWNGNSWPKNPPDKLSAIVHIDAYERLGLAMGKIEKSQYQQNFKRLEMIARRVNENNFFVKSTYYIYEKLGEYGFGYARALSWWAANIAIGTILLFPYKNTIAVKPTFETVLFALKTWGAAIATSFSNAHSFLGLHRGPFKNLYTEKVSEADRLISFNAVWGTQAIVGVLFTFFLVLTLRNKFKAK